MLRVAVVLIAAAFQVAAQEHPRKVLDALLARWPNAHIDKWTVEIEGGKAVHDIEFRMGTRKMEADVDDDGNILGWEKAIPPAYLPATVRQALARKYPKARATESMIVHTIKNGQALLEGYEVVLAERGKKSFEVTVASDGKFLEEPTPTAARP